LNILRSAEAFFKIYPDIKNVLDVREIRNFTTLSRKARMINRHKINNEILQSINTSMLRDYEWH